jgi:hypothetical protein
VAEHGTGCPRHAQIYALCACRLGELCCQVGDQRRERNQVAARIPGEDVQLQRLRELGEHHAQPRRGVLRPAQYEPQTIAAQQPGEKVVGTGDDLQRLAQIVSGHRQQRRQEIAVILAPRPQIDCLPGPSSG